VYALPHFLHCFWPIPASLVAVAWVIGMLLAESVDAVGGVYADCTADFVSGLPQSRQYRAAGSFSWPQKVHVVFAGAGVGVVVGEGDGEG